MERLFTTRPSRVTTMMSMGNRIPNVCTAVVGAMINAWPLSNRSRLSNPIRRLRESNAQAT